eukprot:gene3888-4248_t
MRRAVLATLRLGNQSTKTSIKNCPLFYSGLTLRTEALPSSFRCYHASAIAAAPKGKKGGKNSSDSDGPAAELPKVRAYEQAMDNTVKWFQNELSKIKVGNVSVEMFANLPLPSSSPYPTVGKAGQVVLKTSSKLVVSCFDAAATSVVAEALRNSGLNLSPAVEGTNVLANIPRPSKEAREMMVNNASKTAEKAKLDVRNARKKGLDDAKKVKNSVSEDDFRRFSKELDNVTESKVDTIANAFKAKEKELLAA